MKTIRLVGLMAGLCLPLSVWAHTGLHQMSSLPSGFVHPLGGLDHLLAMLAVGLWAAQLGGSARWLVPCSFVGVMAMGGVLGLYGIEIPFVETGIVASVIFLGLLIASALTVSPFAGAVVVGIFALFHGHAHGVEMPADASGLLYGAGFVMATALLHGGGIIGALGLQRLHVGPWIRAIGSCIALGGCYLALQ